MKRHRNGSSPQQYDIPSESTATTSFHLFLNNCQFYTNKYCRNVVVPPDLRCKYFI